MSQRAVFRGFVLCLLAVVTTFSVRAQSLPGQLTFSPNPVTFGVGQASPLITATIQYPAGAPVPTGQVTLTFNQGFLPTGLSTAPSPVTFTVPAGQTGTTVRFQLVAAPYAFPGPSSLFAYDSTGYVSGTLNYVIDPVTIVPSAVTVRAGTTSAQLTATISYGDFTPQGPQTLAFQGLPPGASSSPSPVTYTPNVRPVYGLATFAISTTTATPAGRYVVTVTSGPTPTGSGTFLLVVGPPGGVTLTASSPSIDVCPGGAGVPNTVTATAFGGYSGSPTITFPLVPADLVVSPLQLGPMRVPPAQSASFTVSALPGASSGPHVVVLQANDASGVRGGTSFVVNVGTPDFAPAFSPAALALTTGGPPATVLVSLAPNACSITASSIAVVPSGLPPGVTVSPASATLSAPDYAPVTFTLAATSATLAGTSAVSFTFTPSSGAAKVIPYSLTVVRTGRVEVSVERRSVDVCPGGAAVPNTATIAAFDGFAGSPTVTFPGLPAGLTVLPATIPVDPLPPDRIVAFSVRADAGLASGPQTVTVMAADSRGVSASATFVANVLPPAFTPVATPSTLALNAGGAAGSIVASLTPGDCPPSSNVSVTPTGLPPGVVVTPTSAVLSPPAFSPVAFSFVAAAGTASGSTNIVLSYAIAGSPSKTAAATIAVCGPPASPSSPLIRPKGNAQGPVTATDFLDLSWGAPAGGFPPTRYEWRINGGAWNAVTTTSATAPPRGVVDPVTLFVRAYACTPETGPGSEASSPVYSLAAPVAGFSVPASVVAGRPVTFTDTSSPQATSWLWFPGDGMAATTVQSPTVTFPAAGPKVVVLVATNGSGSSSKSTTVNVLPASSYRASTGWSVRSLDRQPDGRLALDRVRVDGGATLVLRRLSGEGEAVAFLRLVDADGQVVVERRLVLAAGEEARHDLSAFANGSFRVELVGTEGIEAAVEATVPPGGGEIPVQPRHPRGEGLR